MASKRERVKTVLPSLVILSHINKYCSLHNKRKLIIRQKAGAHAINCCDSLVKHCFFITQCIFFVKYLSNKKKDIIFANRQTKKQVRMKKQDKCNSDSSLLGSSLYLQNENRKQKFFEFSRWISFLRKKECTDVSDISVNEHDKEEDNTTLRLQKYQDFLERLAWDNSDLTFSNGGIEHATILMSVLFQNTKKIARVYCIGFRPNLITRSPYWESLKHYLDDPNHIILVLVETDGYIDAEPLQMLKEKKKERAKIGQGDNIIVKAINDECKQHISDTFGDKHCNFAIFDDDKYRYEYDPINFKAYGSFNQPDNCKILTDEFDTAFDLASRVLI